MQEADSLYIARPGNLVVGPRGDLFIADQFANHVVRIDRDGRPRRVYGKAGNGPGEFRGVGPMFIHRGHLYVGDVYKRTFFSFDLASGAFLRARRFDGVLTRATVQGDVAWLGLENVARGTGIGRWDLVTDSIAYLMPLPDEYTRSQPLAGIYTTVSVAPWADTVLVGYAAGRAGLVATHAGTVLDSVAVPAVRRRGVPEDVARQMESLSFPEMFSLASELTQVHRMPDGSFALVHRDQEIQARRITGEVYVSVLSPDRRPLCVDYYLPVSQDAQPIMTFRGNTLFVLEQRVQAERATTVIRAYQLDPSGCSRKRAT